MMGMRAARRWALLAACFAVAHGAGAQPVGKTPPCHGIENFPTQSALTAMVNAGLIRDFGSIYRDEKTPYLLKTTLLDSEKIGKFSARDFPETEVYRQIQKTTLRTREGQSFEVLTVSEVSFVECSLSEPATVVISPQFRPLTSGTSIFGTKH